MLMQIVPAAHQELQESKDEDSSSAPTIVRKGISHISKAMQEIDDAEKGIRSRSADGDGEPSAEGLKKKKDIIRKMKVRERHEHTLSVTKDRKNHELAVSHVQERRMHAACDIRKRTQSLLT